MGDHGWLLIVHDSGAIRASAPPSCGQGRRANHAFDVATLHASEWRRPPGILRVCASQSIDMSRQQNPIAFTTCVPKRTSEDMNSPEPQLKAIPKKIHVIWVGDDIPSTNRQWIGTWPRLNPDWEVNLWIDAKQLLTYERREATAQSYTGRHDDSTAKQAHMAKVAKELGKQGGDQATIKYLELKLGYRKNELQGMRVQKIASIMDFCTTRRIKLRLIGRDLKMGNIGILYRKELVERGVNFGAASDILRIEILLQHGGVYVDSDVECVRPLGGILCDETHPIFSAVHPVWNKKAPTEEQWGSNNWWKDGVGGNTPMISNSTIACHPRCKGMQAYKQLIKSNYKSLKKDETLRQDYFSKIKDSTIKMTGPTAARDATGFTQKKTELDDHQVPIRTQEDIKLKEMRNKVYMKDYWYFPMYKLIDHYEHAWF
jgi:TcdA/TcdB catalytic glycosyltransferase domain